MAIPKEYWAERQARTQSALTEKSIKDTEKQLAKYYKKAMKSCIEEFEATYNHLLITIGDGKAPTPADLYKLAKYWELQGRMKKELEALGDKTANLLSKKFVEEFEQIYRVMAVKDDLYFSEYDVETARQMINQIWCADGKSWSQRVWTNTAKLQEALNENLIECVLTGKPTSQLKQLLQDQFNVSFNRADSIVRTEMAHIQTQAARQRYLDSGIMEVEVWADKDERRCAECGKLHKKRFPVGGAMPVPAHPKCRCCIIPVVEVN